MTCSAPLSLTIFCYFKYQIEHSFSCRELDIFGNFLAQAESVERLLGLSLNVVEKSVNETLVDFCHENVVKMGHLVTMTGFIGIDVFTAATQYQMYLLGNFTSGHQRSDLVDFLDVFK